jgi:hypothetical protein
MQQVGLLNLLSDDDRRALVSDLTESRLFSIGGNATVYEAG